MKVQLIAADGRSVLDSSAAFNVQVAQRLATPYPLHACLTRACHADCHWNVSQVEWYYFSHYVKHWSEPMFSDALATIPQIMIWDDHDIFDGWGSYPAVLQQCPVFQGKAGELK